LGAWACFVVHPGLTYMDLSNTVGADGYYNWSPRADNGFECHFQKVARHRCSLPGIPLLRPGRARCILVHKAVAKKTIVLLIRCVQLVDADFGVQRGSSVDIPQLVSRRLWHRAEHRHVVGSIFATRLALCFVFAC
jgi:hypothetical protein